MKKIIFVVLFAALGSVGCAIIGGGQNVNDPENPNKGKTWSIWGSNENWAFNEADRICPNAYYVHKEYPNIIFPPLHLMEVECKPEGSGKIDMVVRPVEPEVYNPDGLGKVGEYSFQVEGMKYVRSCNPQPIALLESKSAGLETYKVACTSGDELRVVCNYNNCEIPDKRRRR